MQTQRKYEFSNDKKNLTYIYKKVNNTINYFYKKLSLEFTSS